MYRNSKNSETFDPHRLLLIISDKKNLKKNNKYFALSSLSSHYTWKNIKKSYKFN